MLVVVVTVVVVVVVVVGRVCVCVCVCVCRGRGDLTKLVVVFVTHQNGILQFSHGRHHLCELFSVCHHNVALAPLYVSGGSFGRQAPKFHTHTDIQMQIPPVHFSCLYRGERERGKEKEKEVNWSYADLCRFKKIIKKII